ncbi:MAG: ribose 5-phosphate isomerase B [Dehalococcoidales bacterium]|nr:ribose 5-phosphate isomerase B [Dehalococcoidales bacterium]
MRIAIGCDHRGLNLKSDVIKILTEKGHSFKDFGCCTEQSVDYPDIAEVVSESVASGEYDRGILICSTGVGISIVANKIRGIRAALCYDSFLALRARQHNDANVLCMGAILNKDLLPEIVINFLDGVFEGGRHQRRIDKIKTLENKNQL